MWLRGVKMSKVGHSSLPEDCKHFWFEGAPSGQKDEFVFFPLARDCPKGLPLSKRRRILP